MEEYRNEVVDLQAIDDQNISKFPGKTSWNEPQVRGGHRGLPLGEPLESVSPQPPKEFLNSEFMVPMAPKGKAREPWAPWHPLWPMAPGREINGYPFTTFTDFSDFLGIIPRVSSDDLAYYVDSHWSI